MVHIYDWFSYPKVLATKAERKVWEFLKRINMYSDLQSRLKQVNKIPCINAGGCAFVAYYAYKYMKQQYPESNPQICFLIEHTFPKEVFNAMRNNPSSCSHAVLRLGDLFYDTTKIYTTETLLQKWNHDLVYCIDPDTAYESLQEKDHWNPQFDRKYIPKIHDILSPSYII